MHAPIIYGLMDIKNIGHHEVRAPKSMLIAAVYFALAAAIPASIYIAGMMWGGDYEERKSRDYLQQF